jgi:peptidoglycan hydrolase-like protein with peptidoglycan-binding domain
MATAADVLEVARRELGRHETPPGSNLTKFGAAYGLNPAPWCAEFACSYVWMGAGLAVPGNAQSPKGWASVGLFLGSAKANRWVVAGGKSAQIRPGDYVCYEWDASNTWPDHVGIVVEPHADGSMTTIEGNSPGPDRYDEVAYHVRPRDQVAAFVRPPYSGPTPVHHGPVPRLPKGVILEIGSPHHDLVAIYQKQMLKRGWHGIGKVDGVFDKPLDETTRKFQTRLGLEVDGQVGPETWEAAFEAPIG